MPPDSSSEPKTPRVSAVKFWLGAISAMILITGLLTYAWMPKGPPEPEYQGRTLTEWLKALNAANKGSAELKESEVAIRAIGTNGFPLLLHMMAEYDSSRLDAINVWLDGRSSGKWRLPVAEDRRASAIKGFGVLHETGEFAVPGLLALLSSSFLKNG